MAITLPTGTRNTLADAVDSLVNAGSANAAGLLRIGTTGMASVLSEHDLSNPAFGAAASGVITANSISDDTSANNTGTAAEAQLLDRDRNIIMTLEVGVGKEITMDNYAIQAGTTVKVNSLTITMPAS
jgi:hypothetical protein